MSKIFSSIQLKGHTLPNRIAMAPLTRCRAGAGDVPQAMSAVYYAQRASAGLLISEATNVTSKSCAFEKAPGIYTETQVDGWKVVTDAVHQAGGRIFMQLWHCGRVGSEAILNGEAPLSPSGINDDLAALQVYGQMANGRYAQIAATPSRAMTLAEIEETIADYANGAANAIRAGCDGVEIHAANGYLPHQFMSATLNQRTDKYGGSLQGRLQFLKEVIEAILVKVDASKVGIRISPFAGYNNSRDPDPKETFAAVAKMVESYGLVYLHVADTNAWGGTADMPDIIKTVRPHYTGCLMGNGGIDPIEAQKMVDEGVLDMVAFGRLFLANPDLPARMLGNGPYNEARYVGWYGGDEEGLTDYPSL